MLQGSYQHIIQPTQNSLLHKHNFLNNIMMCLWKTVRLTETKKRHYTLALMCIQGSWAVITWMVSVHFNNADFPQTIIIRCKTFACGGTRKTIKRQYYVWIATWEHLYCRGIY